MRRVLASLALSVGAGLAVWGGYYFVFGHLLGTDDRVVAQGLGPFDGEWSRIDYACLGAVLSAAGCGLFVFGLTWFLALGRSGTAQAPVWRSLLWAFLFAIVAGGVGGFGASLYGKRKPPVASVFEQTEARCVALQYLERPDRKLLTDDFRRRLDAREESVLYGGDYSWHIDPVSIDEVRLTGKVRVKQQVIRRIARDGFSETSADLSEPRDLSFTIRVRKGTDGAWRVDDIDYKE